MTGRKFVCAFRGRRDSYQVPLALAEAGLLDEFITDIYAVPWLKTLSSLGPESIRRKLANRSEPGVPIDRVRCLWGTTLSERIRHRLGLPPAVTFGKLDRRFGLAAARRAARTASDLLLYSPYAWEAFTADYHHDPRKVLFQYHPHPAAERRLLSADSLRFPGAGQSFTGAPYGQAPPEYVLREENAWKHADLILCASTFTKKSLLAAGADERRCRVIPYGVDPVETPFAPQPDERFHALFVGSGGQRKGLHHLLEAWSRASLPVGSRLTLVCRVLDNGIRKIAAETPGAVVLNGVPVEELRRLYARCSLFVMPSLVEGFGQVYLEALAHGCPVLGTPNTALPDLGTESDGVFLAAPGQIGDLAARLERLSRDLPGRQDVRQRARSCAAGFTWERFRMAVRSSLTASSESRPQPDRAAV